MVPVVILTWEIILCRCICEKNNVKGTHHYLKRVDCLNKYLPAFDVVNKLAIYEENE